jgi:hypothetical protein
MALTHQSTPPSRQAVSGTLLTGAIAASAILAAVVVHVITD